MFLDMKGQKSTMIWHLLNIRDVKFCFTLENEGLKYNIFFKFRNLALISRFCLFIQYFYFFI